MILLFSTDFHFFSSWWLADDKLGEAYVVGRLGLLLARRDGLVADEVAGGVDLETLRSALLVNADQSHGNAERAHARALRVDLVDVRHTLSNWMSAYILQIK